MGIPISIAGALAILWAVGGTINMISLFGFIMVLGIVVDDAIVVGEAIYVHRKSGKAALAGRRGRGLRGGHAGGGGGGHHHRGLCPLMYVGGIMGKFIAIMPVVVIACLAVSLVECLILLPAHLSHLPDPNRAGKANPWLTRRLESVNRGRPDGDGVVRDRVYYALFCARPSIGATSVAVHGHRQLLMVTVGWCRRRL
jgi:multidrug efflux pump subunit AcrB